MMTRRRFPGWRWLAVFLAFPLAGYAGWAISGPVDTVGPALLGGLLTGAGLGAVQWWAADGALGDLARWVAATAAGYAVGLALGATVVGYETSTGSLVTMGLISGVVLGTAQAAVLASNDQRALAMAWAAATPLLFALAWAASSGIGVSVEHQFTVFGAAGALLFTIFSGLLFSRFQSDPTIMPAARS